MYLKSNASLQINNTVISFDDYEFIWRYTSKDSENPDYLEVEIPNLARDFVEVLSNEATAIFSFGQDVISNTLVVGYVKDVSIRYSGPTIYHIIKIIEVDTSVFTDISRSYEAHTTASHIIGDILKQCNLTLRSINLVKDLKYPTGYVAYGKLKNVLSKIATACGSKNIIEGNLVDIIDPSDTTKRNVLEIKFGSNLLQEPEKYTQLNKPYDYKITIVADATIRRGSILYLISDTVQSFVKVHEFSINNFIGEYVIEVLEV